MPRDRATDTAQGGLLVSIALQARYIGVTRRYGIYVCRHTDADAVRLPPRG